MIVAPPTSPTLLKRRFTPEKFLNPPCTTSSEKPNSSPTAIAASANDLVTGLIGTVAYGLLGLILMSLSFLIIDAITPGKLGDELATPDLHPATWVNAAAHVVIATIIAAAIW